MSETLNFPWPPTHSSSIPPSPQRSFSCTYPGCKKSFTRKLGLCEHMRICSQAPEHINKKPFPCNLCTRAFTRVNDLKRHEGEVHGEKRFVCQQSLPSGEQWGCGKRFTRSTTLKQHQKECDKYRPKSRPEPRPKVLPSSELSVSTDQPSPKVHALQYSTTILHNPPEAQMSWQSAREAQARQIARISLRAWKSNESQQNNTDKLICRICNARRDKDKVASYINHLLGHLEDLEIDAFECDGCGIGFVLSAHLQRHRHQCGTFRCWFSQGPNPNEIWGCNKQFTSNEDFVRHARGLDCNDCFTRTLVLKNCLKATICAELDKYGTQIMSDSTPQLFNGSRYVRELNLVA